MLPAHWYPVQTKGLVRVGSANDGGYVVPETLFAKTEVLVSCGLGDNWEFEEDFQTRSGCKVVCYDHSVDGTSLLKLEIKRRFRMAKRILFLRALYKGRKGILKFSLYRPYKKFFDNKKAIHFKSAISFERPPTHRSLDGIFSEHEGKSIFVKMDIEGGEYRVLEQMAGREKTLLGVAIELHDIDFHLGLINHWFEAMQGYSLVHIHGTNCGPADDKGDPVVVELTLLRSDLVEPKDGNPSYPLPGLDAPGALGAPNFALRFEAR